MLVASSDHVFSWVDKNDTPGVPKGAITGACSPEGKRIYVIRASHGTKLIAGNHEEGNEYAEYEQIRARQSNEWQYLVSNEEAFGMKIYTLLNNNNNGYYDHSSNHDPIITSIVKKALISQCTLTMLFLICR